MTKLGDYVLSGQEINSNVVRSIDGVGGGGGTQYETLFDGSVATEPNESLGGFNAAACPFSTNVNTLRVIFDGTEYMVNKMDAGSGDVAYGGIGQGGPSFDEFPFAFFFALDGDFIITETAGAHTLKVETAESADGDSDFSKATITINGTPQNNKFTMLLGLIRINSEDEMICTDITISPNDRNIDVVLYKGETHFEMQSSSEITASGNIELGEGWESEGVWHYNAVIVGDCTINCVALMPA